MECNAYMKCNAVELEYEEHGYIPRLDLSDIF